VKQIVNSPIYFSSVQYNSSMGNIFVVFWRSCWDVFCKGSLIWVWNAKQFFKNIYIRNNYAKLLKADTLHIFEINMLKMSRGEGGRAVNYCEILYDSHGVEIGSNATIQYTVLYIGNFKISLLRNCTISPISLTELYLSPAELYYIKNGTVSYH
jgi:hypothetical protein